VLGKSIDDISGTNIVPVFDLVFGDGEGKLQDGSELTSSQIDISEAVMDNPTGQEISVEEYKNSVLGFIRQQVEASGHILGNNA